MMIAIHDGTQHLESRECRIVRLPDGRQGAIWRGLAYPLGPEGDRIDIDGEAFAPGACGTAETPLPFAIIDGEEEAYLVVGGSAADCEHAAEALRNAGCEVMRTGRYLGEPVDGLEADWFVRFVQPAEGGEKLLQKLERVLGATASAGGPQPQNEVPRSRLLAHELALARAREAALRAEVASLHLAAATAVGREQAEAELRTALENERALRTAAEDAAAEALAAQASPRQQAPAAPRKLSDEIGTMIAVLVPRVALARDSLALIAAEYADRSAVYRALEELQRSESGIPPNWKKLKGVDDCWERHVSNGQDDAGRAYAWLDRSDRRWQVLFSHKTAQKRDLDWLDRNRRR